MATLVVAALPALWFKAFCRSECLGLYSTSGNSEETIIPEWNGTQLEAIHSSLESFACTKENENIAETTDIVHLKGRLSEAVVLTRAQVFMLHDLVFLELFRFVRGGERFISPGSFRLSVITFVSVVGSIVHWCCYPLCWKGLFSILFSFNDNFSKLKCMVTFFGYYLLLCILSNIIATTGLLVLYSLNHKQRDHLMKEVFRLLSSIRIVLNEATLYRDSSVDSKSQLMISRENGEELVDRKQIRILLALYSCTSLLREQIKQFQKYIRNQSKQSKDDWLNTLALTSAVGSSVMISFILSKWKTFSTWIDNDDADYSNMFFCTWYAIIGGLYAWHFSYLSNDICFHFFHKEPDNYLERVREQSEQIFALWNQLDATIRDQL